MKMFQVSSLLGLFTAVSVFCTFFLQRAQADIIFAHWGFDTLTNWLSILVSGGQIITFTAALNRTATVNGATIFDNIDLRYSSITPVREPGSCAFLGVLGLIMFGGRAGRNCWARLRRA